MLLPRYTPSQATRLAKLCSYHAIRLAKLHALPSYVLTTLYASPSYTPSQAMLHARLTAQFVQTLWIKKSSFVFDAFCRNSAAGSIEDKGAFFTLCNYILSGTSIPKIRIPSFSTFAVTQLKFNLCCFICSSSSFTIGGISW